MNQTIKSYTKKFIYILISIFLLIWKRNKYWCLCIGWNGQRFADNSRYMFLYLNEQKKQLGLKKIVWLTTNDNLYNELKQNGYDVCQKRSIKGIYYHLHAQYLFYDQLADEYYKFLTYKSKMINLWHGIPIKKFGLWSGDIWDLRNSYLLTCSAFGDHTIGEAFNIQPNHYIHGIYPRNHYLLEKDKWHFLLQIEVNYLTLIQTKIEQGKRIIFYLPTFRKKPLIFLGESDTNILNNFFSFLEKQNFILLTKTHFYGAIKNHDKFFYNNESVINLPANVDIYPFLKKTDILLTDYSSVLFDFLYLNRDIICFPYDLNTYKNSDRGFLYDYNSLPVNFVYNLEELKEYLLSNKPKEKLTQETEYRKLWLNKCFGNHTMEDTVKRMLSL